MRKNVIFVFLFILSMFLVACFPSKEKVEISFDSNGGSLVESIKATEGENISLEESTRDGYTFLGWFTDEKLNKEFTLKKMPPEDITLYAKWQINSYSICLETNGGNLIDNIIKDYGEELTLPKPIREGYNFKGWYIDEDLTNEFDLAAMPASDLTLYARWQINQYMINFETHGGNLINQIIKEYNEDLNLPTPIRDGYEFIGWYTDEGLINEFDLAAMPANDLTLYAKWQINQYMINFETNGGNPIASLTKTYNENLNLPIPVWGDNVFAGWYLDASLNNAFTLETMPANDLTLYAKWNDVKYSIYYQLNGGYWGYKNKYDLVDDFLHDFYNYVNPSENLTTFMHGAGNTSGYKGTWHSAHIEKLYAINSKNPDYKPYFISQPEYNQKWLSFLDMINDIIAEVNPSQSFWGSLYEGQLRLEQYITDCSTPFSAEQLSRIPDYSPSITEYDSNTEIILPVPKMIGATFIGYYDNENFLGEPIYTIEKGSYGDLELFAKWKEDGTGEYNILFNTNGGNNLSSIAIMFGEMVDSLPVPTRSNYLFSHWTCNGELVELPFIFDFEEDIILTTEWLAPYSSSGVPVYHRNGDRVYLPETYSGKQDEFRGVWISNMTGDIARYESKSQMMAQLTEVLDNLEAWNFNAIVYHIRIYNDALYDTDLSPRSNYVSQVNFAQWDYLEWLIAECHKRGIEFHAWMNPYRIASSGTGVKDDYVNRYSDYPQNPANDPDNILITNGGGAILNPGEPEVRDFLVDVCLEVMEKYNVDAIHFDDYFYAAMVQNEDLATYLKYNPQELNISDWRRKQVNMFIRDLSIAMNEFNITNGRSVELGISPSGIWKNGNGIVTYDENGTAITNGSNTAGGEHYDAYLYSDSLKWINEEWIDYICPQAYWGFTHPTAGYADVMDWWIKVVRHKDVKLYTGIGIYMENAASETYSWKSNPYELSDQVLYNSSHSEIDGLSVYRYAHMKSLLNRGNAGALRLINEYWN